MNLEGRIRIAVRLADGHVSDVAIESTRPQLAQKLMAGHTPEEAAEMAGLLFSLCGRAQRIAARVACAAAAGHGRDAANEQAMPILAEWTREHAWRLLLNWPATTGQTPDPDGLQALHRAGEAPGPLAQAVEALLVGQLLGEAPERWLGRDWTAFQSWLDTGRHAARLFDVPHDGPEADACATALLPTLQAMDDAAVEDLARRALEDIDFCTRPTWQGATAETGALPRVLDHPLMAAWLERRGQGADARLLARMIELARMPARLRNDGENVARAWTLADGTGIAGVETSRGVLFHIVRLDGGRVRDYRIVSPTEWNFHPTGPLIEAMRRLPVDERLDARARRLALAFDPCVDYGVEIEHA